MTSLIETLNQLLAVGTVILQIAAVVLVIAYFTSKKDTLMHFFSKWGILVAFVVALVSTVLTLIYSDVFGFVPCGLCWLQRVFLYPQVVILGIALWKKHRGVADYIIGLSALGALVALYQHYLQMGGAEFIVCPTAGGADCAQRIVFEFGYITFPLMAFSTFLFLIVLMLFVRRGEAV